MPLENELIEAVKKIVNKENQPKAVADRLIAWLEEASQAEITEEDEKRFLKSLRNSIDLEGYNNAN